MKAILIISPEAWDAHQVSKHHYAITLAKLGCRVFFLNPPSRVSQISIKKDDVSGVELIDAPIVFRGLRFLPRAVSIVLERRWLKKLETEAGCHIDIIWLFENSRFYNMRFAGERLKIYHQVDLNQNFNPKVAAKTADICFCTSDYIKHDLSAHSSKAFKVHHGLAEPIKPGELSINQRAWLEPKQVQAAYIGNLDISLLDVTLLVKIVIQNPEVLFHFVGGYKEGGLLYSMLSGVSNVQWWGKVGSHLIPAILNSVDVLVVTYKEGFRGQVSSPHKMMEYLACGKVIVATYTDEYKDKGHLLAMVDDSNDYITVFKSVIENLGEYNNPVKVAQRIAFAQEHSYSKQVECINQKLLSHNLPSIK